MNIIVLLFYNSKLAESVESGLVSLFHNLGRSGPGSAQVHFLLVYIFVILKNLAFFSSVCVLLCFTVCKLQCQVGQLEKERVIFSSVIADLSVTAICKPLGSCDQGEGARGTPEKGL